MSCFKAKMHQIRFRLHSVQDPAGGGYSAPTQSPQLVWAEARDEIEFGAF